MSPDFERQKWAKKRRNGNDAEQKALAQKLSRRECSQIKHNF